MKAIPQLPSTRAQSGCGTFRTVLAISFTMGLGATHAAQPTLQPLFSGKCPVFAYRVAVSGKYAYVAGYDAGLRVVDVSTPANCVPKCSQCSVSCNWQP
jgi:hypothetical protein